MKIIKHGKPPAKTTYKCICEGCRCVFEVEASEAKFHSDFRDGDYYSVKCPENFCQKLTNISADEFTFRTGRRDRR